MLTPHCLNQTVYRVIDIVTVGQYHLIVEKNCLLGIIPNAGDIAHWVIGVEQVLQDCPTPRSL
jgi:hypothetical protein